MSNPNLGSHSRDAEHLQLAHALEVQHALGTRVDLGSHLGATCLPAVGGDEHLSMALAGPVGTCVSACIVLGVTIENMLMHTASMGCEQLAEMNT